MTDKERIYKYLNKEIQHRSFRKWLIEHADISTLFGKEDAQELSELTLSYSNEKKLELSSLDMWT